MMAFSPVLYQREGLEGARRKQVVMVLQAALEAVDPTTAVHQHLRREGDTLWVGEVPYKLEPSTRVYVVGAGKAGAPMARAVEEILGEHITAGLVTVKYGYTLPTQVVELVQAGHPIPDEAGVNGARKVAALLQDVTPDDLVLCLISGGGSALMTWPVEGLTLEDMRALTDPLLRLGATINEINTIRKHLERLKGGGLARLACPARLVSLILSDVVGNPLDVIASGPTVPDTSTFAQAYQLLERYNLLSKTSPATVTHLRRGSEGAIAETPKPGDPIFQRAQNVIIASNDHAARAAQCAAEELGFHALMLSTYVEGEAREVAKVLAAIAKEVSASDRPIPRPACIIAGGETTVTVKGQGKGGRNQEMALMAAMRIEGLEDVTIACLATDGTDGPTDASGALADGNTVRRAAQLGLDPWEHLERNDSYPFFAALGDLLLTGPTNTNVNDLAFVFVW